MENEYQQLIMFVIGLAGFGVGAVVGGGSALVIIARILAKVKSDLPSLDYMEKLYNSISIQAARDIIRDVSVIGVKVTDGLPNTAEAVKPIEAGQLG